jgi:hypothetical protein
MHVHIAVDRGRRFKSLCAGPRRPAPARAPRHLRCALQCTGDVACTPHLGISTLQRPSRQPHTVGLITAQQPLQKFHSSDVRQAKSRYR